MSQRTKARAGSRSASRRSNAGSSASGRSSSATSRNAVQLLKQDHREVEKLLEQFERARSGKKQAIAAQICQALTIHAQIEEELFYPAAREALGSSDEDLVDEAAVEHGSLKDLISQIETSSEGDDLYDARVKVLGEYVKHHVKEEEGELFPKVSKTSLDLDELGEQLGQRKSQLQSGQEQMPTGSRQSMGSEEEDADEEESSLAPPRSADRGVSRPTRSHH